MDDLPLLAVLFTAGVACAADAPVSKECQLKAAFLYNFAKFVEWPAQTLPEPQTPIIIGVVGSAAMRAELEKAVKDRKINGRELVVKRVESPSTARDTHMLFLPVSEDPRLDRWMKALEGTSVLTVGESAPFVKRGGMITFTLETDKLRFEINADSAERAGLKISAQLQKLARTVQRKPREEGP